MKLSGSASEQPARVALPAPPQPELLAVSEVGTSVTMMNVDHPTGTRKVVLS